MVGMGAEKELERVLGQDGNEKLQIAQREERNEREKREERAKNVAGEPVQYIWNKERDVEKDAGKPGDKEILHGVGSQSISDIDSGEDTKPRTKPQPRAPWHHRWNLLKGAPPPVPKERTISREYNAPFLSLLTYAIHPVPFLLMLKSPPASNG